MAVKEPRNPAGAQPELREADELMSWLVWVIIIIVVVALILGAILAIQARRRRSGVVISGRRGPK